MYKLLQKLIVGCVVFASVCSGAEGPTAAVDVTDHAIPVLHTQEGSASFDHWLVVGPFTGGGLTDLLSRDHAGGQLKRFGREAASGATEPANVLQYATSAEAKSDLKTVTGGSVDLKMLYQQSYEDSEPASAAYLLCKIKSEHARQTYLLFGCDDAARVWLNGKLLMEQTRERHVNQYSEALKIDLAAGENVLCIKTVRSRRGWTVAARLAATAAEATDIALKGHAMLHGVLLQGAVFPEGKPVIFSPRGVPADARIDCGIKDFGKTWEKRSELAGRRAAFAGSEALAPGLYWAEVLHNGVLYEQPFIKGDLKAVAATWSKKSETLQVDGVARINLEVIQRRLNTLLAGDEKNRQDRTVIHALLELATMVDAIESHREPCASVSGMHVRAFRSKIDDQVEHYRVFAPSTVKSGTKLPLVVILPTTVSSKKPFIESAFMKAHLEAERICGIAEKYGVVVLWCGYRKPLRADPCEYAHVGEAIDEVTRDYNVDPGAISLAGSCSGGVLALGLLTREPERFAAVALHNAVFAVDRNTSPEVVRSCYTNPLFLKWVVKRTDIPEYLATSSAPILLVHDGEVKEGHGDIGISLRFEERARRAGKQVAFEQIPQTVSEHMAAWDRMIGWLSKARRNPAGKPISTAKTVVEFFTQRFVVVTGNGGLAEEQQAARQLSERFAGEWRQQMFGDCRRVDENAVDKTQLTGENIVLIGNQSSSRLWSELAGKAGLMVEPDRIRLGERVWNGKDLAIQVRVDSPLSSGNSIVFVGGNSLGKAKLPTMNLAMDGWYQYAVWDAQGRLVDAGML